MYRALAERVAAGHSPLPEKREQESAGGMRRAFCQGKRRCGTAVRLRPDLTDGRSPGGPDARVGGVADVGEDHIAAATMAAGPTSLLITPTANRCHLKVQRAWERSQMRGPVSSTGHRPFLAGNGRLSRDAVRRFIVLSCGRTYVPHCPPPSERKDRNA